MSHWRNWLGMAVSLACLVLAVRGVEWSEVWSQLLQADPPLLLASGILAMALLAARASRWGVLLMALRRGASWGRMFAALDIGYMVSNLLPARVGDLARAYLWGDWTGASKVATLSTVAMEHVVDLLCAFVVMLLLLPFVALPQWALGSGLAAGGMAVSAIALLTVLVGRQGVVLRWVGRAGRSLPLLSGARLERLTLSMLEGLAVLRRPREGSAVVLWSALIWGGQVVYTYAVLRALDLQVSPAAAATLMVFTSLGVAVPSAPGSVGVYHYVAVLTLGLFGVEREPALGAALLIHGLSYALITSTGLLLAWRASLSWGHIRGLQRGIDGRPATERVG